MVGWNLINTYINFFQYPVTSAKDNESQGKYEMHFKYVCICYV